jgi:ribosomal protein L29
MTARAVALDYLRALTIDELAAHLREQRGQLFQVRLQQTIGQVENHRQIRAIRNEIARTMTVQVEHRLAAERGEPVGAPAAVGAAPARRGRRAGAVDPQAAPRRSLRRPRAAAPAVAEEPALEAVSDIEVERIAPESTEPDTVTSGAAAAADEDQE